VLRVRRIQVTNYYALVLGVGLLRLVALGVTLHPLRALQFRVFLTKSLHRIRVAV
jgi:hypothetical protein